MNNFRKEYGQAMKELPEFHMEAECVQDELHHRRMQKQRRNRLIVKGCTAAVVFLLCGAGSVAAKSYMNSVIKVRDNGYTVTGGEDVETVTLARGGTEEAEDSILEDSISEDSSGTAMLYGVEECDDSILVESVISENQEYESFRDFLDHSAVTAKIPDIGIMESEFEEAYVSVNDDSMMTYVTVIAQGKYFSLVQTDYRGSKGYSSGTAYTGKTANERNYTNSQGLNYVVFDTIGENGEIEAIHAVITVEERELCLDFSGFERETIEKVLTDLDLTVYFTD